MSVGDETTLQETLNSHIGGFKVGKDLHIEQSKRIGIVGYGKLGQYLYKSVKESETMEIAFVWNRNKDKLIHIPAKEVLDDLDDFGERNIDLVIEVAHSSITQEYGSKFLQKCDYMIGSPTALADSDLHQRLVHFSREYKHSVYIPAGAFWGAEDITKMADEGSLKGLKVTMKKHPSSFKLLGDLVEKNNKVEDEPVVLYSGPVRQLCPLAPANVNTMACAAIAAHNLGFDQVQGCLIADKSLNCHIVEVEVMGPTSTENNQFTVKTVRTNPSQTGAVTGNFTFASFYQSLKRARGKGVGVHLC